MSFERDIKLGGLVEDVMEVGTVKLGAQKRVAMHCEAVKKGAWIKRARTYCQQ